MTTAIAFTSCRQVRSTYEKDLAACFDNVTEPQFLLSEEKIQNLPLPVRNYLSVCGFSGKEIPMNAEVVWAESFIKMKPDAGWMKLKTQQFNSVREPFRIAYMKALIMGIIPFEGRDVYYGGNGHMYGKIGKLITIFDEKEKEIAQSALIIILAECLLVPGYALQDYIQWEEVDEYTARAIITHKGIEASGLFHFNKAGELYLFETHYRYYMGPQGNVLTPFSAEVGDYFTQGDLRLPGSLKAVWHIDSGRYEYWKGKISEVKYNISLGQK